LKLVLLGIKSRQAAKVAAQVFDDRSKPEMIAYEFFSEYAFSILELRVAGNG
jgi:predicted ATPase